MNLGQTRSGADGLAVLFLPFCSSALTTGVIRYSSSPGNTDTGGSSFFGQIIDLRTHCGYGSAVVIIGTKALQAATTGDHSKITGHWEMNTSSAFTDGSTTLGSTFTLNLNPSSAGATMEGVLVGAADLGTADQLRYIRFEYVLEVSSENGDYVTMSPIYMLGGRDESPATYNVPIGGQSSSGLDS